MRLLANYPNPFNPETWLPFALREEAAVTLRIYGAQGALVREINLGRTSADYHVSRDSSARWDGRNSIGELVASGVHICEVRADHYRDTCRIMMSK